MPLIPSRRHSTVVRASFTALAMLAGRSLGAQATREIRVVGTDYAYMAPDTVRAGRVAFRFENRGVKSHEVAVVLARRGTTAEMITGAAKSGLPTPKLAESYSDGPPMGALFTAPGAVGTTTLVATLERGRTYVLVCTLRESAATPQHASLGMFHLVYVR